MIWNVLTLVNPLLREKDNFDINAQLSEKRFSNKRIGFLSLTVLVVVFENLSMSTIGQLNIRTVVLMQQVFFCDNSMQMLYDPITFQVLGTAVSFCAKHSSDVCSNSDAHTFVMKIVTQKCKKIMGADC